MRKQELEEHSCSTTAGTYEIQTNGEVSFKNFISGGAWKWTLTNISNRINILRFFQSKIKTYTKNQA